jgi:hypothetical protein
MQKIWIIIMLITSCTSKKVINNHSFYMKQLTGGNIKFWNIQPSKDGVIKENCWIFRQNGTFSYFDYLKFKNNGNVEIMQWLADDIKIGDNGIIPWTLKSDTIELSRIKYRILKLSNDSLLVESPASKYSAVDTLLFTHCAKCTYSKHID